MSHHRESDIPLCRSAPSQGVIIDSRSAPVGSLPSLVRKGRIQSPWLDSILSPECRPVERGPGRGLTIGVLAVQGDFREHRMMLESLGAATREVRSPRDLAGLNGLVLPGGESTAISRLVTAYHLAEPIRTFARTSAVFATCAGFIMSAAGTVEGYPPTLGLIDVVARRNAFGRQVSSFEVDLRVVGFHGGPVRAVFIRAPWVEEAGEEVETLAEFQEHSVAVRQGHLLATAFHPELTDDARVHELFISMARKCSEASPAQRPGFP